MACTSMWSTASHYKTAFSMATALNSLLASRHTRLHAKEVLSTASLPCLQNVIHGVDNLLLPGAPAAAAKPATPAAAGKPAAKPATPAAGMRSATGRRLQQHWSGTNVPAFNAATLGYYQVGVETCRVTLCMLCSTSESAWLFLGQLIDRTELPRHMHSL